MGFLALAIATTSAFMAPHFMSAEALAQAPLSSSTIEMLVQLDADEAGIDWRPVYETLRCESGFRNIQSLIPKNGAPNGRENSWGIAQINLGAHPDITRLQALDERFAIAWTVEEFALGQQHMWTCARKLGYAV